MERKLLYVSIFAISMAFLETSVVIYLRELMYPDGFSFPLAPFRADLALIELLREAATLIMLVMIGVLTAKFFVERFAWFLFSFAIWDIFYYVFLKLFIDWPESILTWDILFLIPITWTGPVLAPVLVSLMMIALALTLLKFKNKEHTINIRVKEWTGLIIGSLIMILAFTLDYSIFILQRFNFWKIFTIPDKSALFDYAIQYVPQKFPWIIFITGYVIILYVIYLVYTSGRKQNRSLMVN